MLKEAPADFNNGDGFLSTILLTMVSFFLFIGISSGYAQLTDTSLSSKNIKKQDTIAKSEAITHSPKKATILSAILPGLGQGYNKKYWKIPFIYAGLGGLAYSFNANHVKYTTYRNAYKFRLDGDPLTVDIYTNFSDGDLVTLYKFYERYRNLSFIGITVVYILNVVDASVDAHLFTFDVSDDLSFNLQPTLINTARSNHYSSGFSLTIRF